MVTLTGAELVPIPIEPDKTLLLSTFRFPSTLSPALNEASPVVVRVLFMTVVPSTFKA